MSHSEMKVNYFEKIVVIHRPKSFPSYHITARPAEKIDTDGGGSPLAHSPSVWPPSTDRPDLLGSARPGPPVLRVHYLSVIVARLDFATTSSVAGCLDVRS